MTNTSIELGLTSSTNELFPQNSLNAVEEKIISPRERFRTVDETWNEPEEINKLSKISALSTSDVHISVKSDPIIGFAQEELLPLADACAPLETILHNLSFYVEMAVRETPSEPPDGLTVDESAAIRLYTIEWEKPHRSLYSQLNHTLKWRPRSELLPYYKYLKLFLTALVKIPPLPMRTVWRGVTKTMIDQFQRGTQVTWWSFSSCTCELSVLENQMYLGMTGARTLFSVEAINVRSIRAHSHFVSEDEVLLLPGTLMEVNSFFSPAEDLHIIHLKQIKPNETLLESPFEGAQLYPPDPLFVPWYKRRRIIIALALILVLSCFGIIFGTVYGLKNSEETPCKVGVVSVQASYMWSFDCDNMQEDTTNMELGVAVNGVSYADTDFSGQGKALILNGDAKQYIQLTSSLNVLKNTSFTLSAWLLPNGYSKRTIFGQCYSKVQLCFSVGITDAVFQWQILSIVTGEAIHISNVHMDDFVCSFCWIYGTFLLDREMDMIRFYLNGIKMIEHSFNSNLTLDEIIGSLTNHACMGCNTLSTNDTFHGFMDQLSISQFVKSDAEILREATTLTNYTFDNENVNLDSGPNNIKASSQHAYQSNRNGHSSLLLNTTDSFFQSLGFTTLDSNNYDYTISFWIRLVLPNTDSLNKSQIAILQLSMSSDGISSDSYGCIFIIYLHPENGSIGLFFFKTLEFVLLDEPVANNTWIHLGITYFSPQSFLLYVNGKLVRTISNRRYSTMIAPIPRYSLAFGGAFLDYKMTEKPSYFEQMKCFISFSTIHFTSMHAEIDNLLVYARRLTETEFFDIAERTKPF